MGRPFGGDVRKLVYAPGLPLDNAEVAPLQRDDLSGLPPAVIITAEFDVLRDEAFLYSKRLSASGVPVTYRCFPGQIHCLLGLPPDADELRDLDKIIMEALGRAWKIE